MCCVPMAVITPRIRLCNRAEEGDFAAAVGAHFHDVDGLGFLAS